MKFKRNLILFSITLATVFITALLWFTPLKVSAATLDQVRLSWQNDPKTTMTVMWRTDMAITPRVEYGTTATLGLQQSGTSGPAVEDGYFYHTVELDGLTPNTTYHYRVNGLPAQAGADNAFSNTYTFRTAPSGPADFSFVAVGDIGVRNNNGTRTLKTKDNIAAQNPTLFLPLGDLTYADGDSNPKGNWEDWFEEVERFSHTTPIMPAFGNHEGKSDVRFENETFYERSLALPRVSGSELYYSFDYGSVHFIALNSDDYRSLRQGGAQYQWLTQDLQNNTKNLIVVYFHHVAFGTGEHQPLQDLQRYVVPLFDQYGVDLALYGHNHHYERTLPLKYNAADYKAPIIAATDDDTYINSGGTVYVVSGGGGAGLYDFNDPKPAWSQVRCKCHALTRVDVGANGTIAVTTKDIDGNQIDAFTISSDSNATPPTPAPQPSPPEGGAGVSNTSPLPEGEGQGEGISNAQTIRGFNFAVWWHDSLGKAEARESIDKMIETGANYFGLAPFWYQDSKTSTTIYRRDDKTATDASVRSAIQYAKSKGLKVFLKPMVDSRDDTWRGQLEPSDPGAWFQSYKEFILNYARIAQEEGADWLAVGTEFDSLTTSQYTAKWREVIAAVRAVYSGKLTYAANWGTRSNGEYYQVEFWDALDAIGIDAYFPVARDSSPDVASVQSAWTFINAGGVNENWFADIKARHDQFGKPVIFTEIGFLSCNEAGVRPWTYPCSKGVDLQEQAVLYEGTLRFWKDVDWMLGYLWWRWDVDPDKGGENNGDYLVQGKQPTIDVLKRFWIASAGDPSPQSSSAGRGGLIAFPLPVGEGQGEGAPGGGSSSSTGSSAIVHGGGGSGPISNAINYRTPTYPTSNQANQRAYGSLRFDKSVETTRAQELSQALKAHFKGSIPLHARFWSGYVDAYVYGNYPVAAISRAIELGGKTVHPSIPWSAWRRSGDYQLTMSKNQIIAPSPSPLPEGEGAAQSSSGAGEGSMPKPFSYGKPRLPLWQERVRVWQELAVPLRAHFKGSIPLSARHWPYYVNAYLYGNYPVEAIARSIELGGKTVHPSIPWMQWKNSLEYKKFIN